MNKIASIISLALLMPLAALAQTVKSPDGNVSLTFSLTGELGIVGVARGRKKGLAKLVDYFRRGCAKDGGNLVVAIGDADAREDGNALAERIKEQFPGARTLRSTIGPTIGCHVGPGMVSCCFWGEDRRSA